MQLTSRALITTTLILISNIALAELHVTQAKIRLLPPSVPNTSAYFEIENSGENDVTLVGGKADIANKVELHNHIMSGDVMRMEKQSAVIIPAGKTITFAPGGLHMMIFGLKQPLKKEQIVPLALMTIDGQQIKFDAHVVSPNQHRHH
ncbi:copper chaperone PCu(A)C [Paraglaciecola agarilytica]|uniref:copper chaperone PCu(A)C n=1 Tax=Paraglaciecola chathamensis TaxID=368405 RepID=UPI001C0A1163|nr:copper chaperone PCu(A)C [Paraglaciecola agarilytica]MBU3020097.1 copper chaperone PCu(A)C [Paraglaciecola agarilytica]